MPALDGLLVGAVLVGEEALEDPSDALGGEDVPDPDGVRLGVLWAGEGGVKVRVRVSEIISVNSAYTLN